MSNAEDTALANEDVGNEDQRIEHADDDRPYLRRPNN